MTTTGSSSCVSLVVPLQSVALLWLRLSIFHSLTDSLTRPFRSFWPPFGAQQPIQQQLLYRRLGNGAAFYGKRKSNFYGEQDKNRKTDREQADPTEDYQGPDNAGYFQWAPDEDGQMRPVTRMKNQIVERNPKYWDRVYEKEDEA
jgi:hypothetical protein